MNRHVATYHLELAQLWRCPVSWCTVWKGTPQDCMDHLRLEHAVLAAVKTVNLGRWFPPWTVRRQTWNDALKPSNLGISTDMLLFSELGHALVHHYGVFQKGTSHVSLRGDYLTRLRTFVTMSAAMSRWSQRDDTGQSSSAPDSLCSPRNIRRRDSDEEYPRKSRCRTRWARSPRVEDVPDVLLSPVAVSPGDPDAIIYDCQPPILHYVRTM